MPVVPHITKLHAEMTAWRRNLHAHPEIAFQETRTADFVAAKLGEFGIEVHRGLARTGVVGRLVNGNGPAIGLRGDMDALPIAEINAFAHRSVNADMMYACGHDGHTTMLLGAARYLAETRDFQGTVHFIFQPAEENEGGGRVMVEEGLFETFACDRVFGMHNWPGMAVGEFAVGAGPMMASADNFEITVQGRGSHAAMPHLGIDPVFIGAEIVTALQSISSRATDAVDALVVSVTQFHGGDAWNVIPDSVRLRGTVRAFRAEVRDRAEAAIGRIASGIAEAHGGSADFTYIRRYPATENHADEAEMAAAAASAVVGPENVDRAPQPCMGSEDFSFMLLARPGAYIWIGNGASDGGRTLHNARYDFNDEILPIGASYWARMAETLLAR